MGRVLAPFEEQIARALSAPNATFVDNTELMITLLLDKAPEFVTGVLSKIDVKVAEDGLADCLRKKEEHKRSAALLVEAAIELQGPTGKMARRLRQRFPKASISLVTSRQ